MARLAPGFGYEAPTALALSTLATVSVTGVSVLGAAFLLAWAAETAEKDVPSAFAIAVLAVIAVAPEYAVDALYAWEAGALAGTERGIEAGNLAVANMTGANRILIGIGWAGVALFTVFRRRSSLDPSVRKRGRVLRSAVEIDREIVVDIFFLLLATLWAFLIPLNGGIDALDTVVLVGIYVAYIVTVLRRDVEPDEEHVGVPAYLQTLGPRARAVVVVSLFAFSGAVIFTAVEPFAHGLEEVGEAAGIPSFFMIQWVAPLASESPELVVVLYLVNKARSTAGFNTLISSKLNQWTLLIGTLVVVHSVALGGYGALAFDGKQAAEIWLTAAQSFFAIAVLVDFEVTVGEAVTLLTLFLSQVFLEFLLIRDAVALPVTSRGLLLLFTGVYVVLGAGLFAVRRDDVASFVRRSVGVILGRDRGQ
jgi:cation:H+ antiporter